MSKYKKSEANILDHYETALTNAVATPEIKALLEEYGYDDTLMAEGRERYARARAAYDLNKKEDDETAEARFDFKNKRDALDKTFKKDRKKAMLAFKRDEPVLQRLSLISTYARSYAKWIETVKKFYDDLKAPELLSKMARFKIDGAYVDARLAEIDTVKEARNLYVKEDGESQQATKDKNKALEVLDDWMDDFKDTAYIALEEQPQLLEVLGYFVRS